MHDRTTYEEAVDMQRMLGFRLALLLAAVTGALALAGLSAQQKPSITLSPSTGPTSTPITVTGANFKPGDTVSIEILGNLETRPLTRAAVGQDGRFAATISLPVDGVYSNHITLLAFPLSLPERSSASLAQAPTADFTITQPTPAQQLPGTGTGRGVPTRRDVVALLLIATVLAVMAAVVWRTTRNQNEGH